MIVDCVTFFNEAPLLELRLCELDPVVDLFVVVEADRTHAGAEKPSYLPPALVRRWAHKLHVSTATLPGDAPGDLLWTWRREIAQRNAIGVALDRLRLSPDDMVLISDCDELPRRAFVQMLPGLPPDGIAIAQQRLSYYSFNHVAADPWLGTRATQYANVEALGADGVRYASRARGGFPRLFPVEHAGWHFSYFGGPDAIRAKMTSFLHQEFNRPEHTDAATIAARIAAGDDIYGRAEQAFTIGPAFDLPTVVYERPAQWAAHFHPAYAPRFHEDWMASDQTAALSALAATAPPDGACLEIGVWEGRSAIAIAHGLGDRELLAIDTWLGNRDEGDEHPSVIAAAARDVQTQFHANVAAFGLTNVVPVQCDWRDFTFPARIAFAHLDASHDADTVSAQLDALVPRMVPGGILCGDDWHTGGVRLALTRLRGVESDGKLWWWRMSDGD